MVVLVGAVVLEVAGAPLVLIGVGVGLQVAEVFLSSWGVGQLLSPEHPFVVLIEFLLVH